MDEATKERINEYGLELEGIVEFGRISFNFANDKYVNANIEESVKPEQK